MIQAKVGRKTERINSLAGLKAGCLLLLFLWHGPFPHPKTDLGARTCEFLFLTSGFLVGYNGFYKQVPSTWAESFRYVGKKLAAFWPLHAITMLAVMFALVDPILSKKNLIDAVINLSLQQAWSEKTQFSFNGTSWFLSALMFCYFLVPFLLKLAKNVRTSCCLFLFTFLVRAGIEWVLINFPGQFWTISVHCFPVIRALEFTMGMMLVPTFMRIKERDSSSYIVMSALEIAALLGAVWVSINYNGRWPRSGYLIPYSALLFVFAFDRGILSRLLSCKAVKWFSDIQFEFFVFHQAVILCFSPPLEHLLRGWRLGIVLFVITVTLSELYKKYLSKRFSALFIRIQNAILRMLQIDL